MNRYVFLSFTLLIPAYTWTWSHGTMSTNTTTTTTPPKDSPCSDNKDTSLNNDNSLISHPSDCGFCFNYTNSHIPQEDKQLDIKNISTLNYGISFLDKSDGIFGPMITAEDTKGNSIVGIYFNEHISVKKHSKSNNTIRSLHPHYFTLLLSEYGERNSITIIPQEHCLSLKHIKDIKYEETQGTLPLIQLIAKEDNGNTIIATKCGDSIRIKRLNKSSDTMLPSDYYTILLSEYNKRNGSGDGFNYEHHTYDIHPRHTHAYVKSSSSGSSSSSDTVEPGVKPRRSSSASSSSSENFPVENFPSSSSFSSSYTSD